VIAFWHHPPYTKGSHDSDTDNELVEMRQNAVDLLEQYGVDLVLGGHSHSYERSYFINGHYGLANTFTDDFKLDLGDGDPAGDGAYRKANADGTEPITERGNHATKIGERVLAIAQLGEMSDFLRGLERESKIFRGLREPILDCLRRWDAMKSIVDLGCGKPLSEVGQHLARGKILRVKISFPFFITKSRTPDFPMHILSLFI
jgi:hypothetical protein